MQPDVAPAAGSSRCCRTTGGRARGRRAAPWPSRRRRKLRPKIDRPCASSGISRSSSVTTTGTGPRTGTPKSRDEHAHHLALAGERSVASVWARLGEHDVDGHRLVGEACARRSGRSARSRGTSPSARAARSARSSCSRRDVCSTRRPLHSTWYAVGRGELDDRYVALSRRSVVAGEPGRGAVRLRGDDHAVGELLPPGVAERPAPPERDGRRTRSPPVSSSPAVAGRGRRISSRPAAMGELRGPDAVDASPSSPTAACRSRARRRVSFGTRQRRVAGRPGGCRPRRSAGRGAYDSTSNRRSPCPGT